MPCGEATGLPMRPRRHRCLLDLLLRFYFQIHHRLQHGPENPCSPCWSPVFMWYSPLIGILSHSFRNLLSESGLETACSSQLVEVHLRLRTGTTIPEVWPVQKCHPATQTRLPAFHTTDHALPSLTSFLSDKEQYTMIKIHWYFILLQILTFLPL